MGRVDSCSLPLLQPNHPESDRLLGRYALGGHWGSTKSSTFIAGDGKVYVVIRGPDSLGIVPSSGKWVSRPEEVRAVR